MTETQLPPSTFLCFYSTEMEWALRAVVTGTSPIAQGSSIHLATHMCVNVRTCVRVSARYVCMSVCAPG